jgi:threonylcarbamoyladenosine tRNA methylthiotransferase MtaB
MPAEQRRSSALSVAVATLGCKVNQFESAAFITGFRELGCKIVAASSKASIFVLNTCAVTARAGQQSRQLIRKTARAHPKAKLVVTGCYAEIAADELPGLVPDSSMTVIGNAGKHQLVQTALNEQKPLLHTATDIAAARTICPLAVRRFGSRTRAYLRIQDGCNNFCSYCIVPYTRGRSRSLPLAQVLEQGRIFTEEGYSEIVVTGINVGKYGLDLAEGKDIYALLDILCREFPQTRIRLSSIEPTEVNDRLFDLFARHRNFMPHLHIPLQSGDNAILARMNRRYTAATFAHAVERIRALVPHAAVGCDVLAGFPGEDEQAAADSCQLLDALPISYLHVFPYSIRPGTAAANLPEQVPGPLKEERTAKLHDLDRKKRTAFYQQQVGTEQRVLIERKDRKTSLLKGFSENYIPVLCNGPSSLIRTVVRMRLVEARQEAVLGERQEA